MNYVELNIIQGSFILCRRVLFEEREENHGAERCDGHRLADLFPRRRGTSEDAQETEGLCAGPEEKTDQSSHDAVDLPTDGGHQLDALPRRSGWSHLDERGAEKDRLLLLPGGQGNLRGPIRESGRNFLKIRQKQKMKFVFRENC